MPTSQSVSERHGIIAWWENAGGDTAQLVVPIAIPVRRSMEPTGHGAASNIGQPIPTLGVQATITLSKIAKSAIGSKMPVPARLAAGLTAYWRTCTFTNSSILVRKKQSNASASLQTTGSFSLKELVKPLERSRNCYHSLNCTRSDRTRARE